MSAGMIINGWRQQSADRRQILRWLAQARQLGFTSYSLHRVKQQYWLCCITAGLRSATAGDLAIILQHQFKNESQLLYLQFDAAQMICVSWQEFKLRNCVALSTDEPGLARFRLLCQGIAEQVRAEGQAHGSLIVAGQVPATFAGLIDELGTPRETMPSGIYGQEKIPAAARFRAISKSPGWHRQHLWLAGIAALLGIGIALAWLWWPSPEPIPVVREVVRAELPGLPVSQVSHLEQAMHQLTALAGWQLQQLALNEQGLQASLRRTYGLNQELVAQLDERWQTSFSNDEAQLQLPLAKPVADAGLSAQDYQDALRVFSTVLPDYLPTVRLQLAETGADSQLRWQNLTLNFTDFSLPELELLRLLLRDAPVRVQQARIEQGSPARASIQLQFIARSHHPGGTRP